MEELKIPRHVAIILDGNRRWAHAHKLPKLEGHRRGFEKVKKMARYILSKDVKYLSLYCFSTENFKREVSEVKYLMDLFIEMFKGAAEELHQNNIKVIFSGRRSNLRNDVLDAMDYLSEKTKNNTGGVLNLCLNYGGQSEIVDACKKIYSDIDKKNISVDDLDTEKFSKYLYQDLPPVDLMIRTGGDLRISNFLLWQLAYAEFYFSKLCWPDFSEEEFDNVLLAYNGRERRFGGGK